MKKSRIACIQNSAGTDPAKNLKKVFELTRQALKKNPDCVALPESFYWRGSKKDMMYVAKHATKKVLAAFSEMARKSRTVFILGSIIEAVEHKNRFYNTLVVISARGKVTALYRKIHLFDVKIPQGVRICESDTTLPGADTVTVDLFRKKAGFGICYDLRFPELFRELTFRGSSVIFLPANFTKKTGEAHWETLIRARAIENQVFMVAPAQTGTHPVTGVASFGTSMIVDPWGRVLAKASQAGEEVIWADLDWDLQARLRREFPVLKHAGCA